jgi:L-erythro-3,5-diaminohexanoate dehydrogenase
VRAVVAPLTHGRGADLTSPASTCPACELSAIVATRDRGKVYFFAMSTELHRRALGAEGIGRDVDLFIGNGYAHGHAEHTLDILREDNRLRSLFERRYT